MIESMYKNSDGHYQLFEKFYEMNFLVSLPRTQLQIKARFNNF